MSHSRKKMSACDVSFLSITQKLAEQPTRKQFRRKCCDKENECSREGRQCKSRDQNKSLKKQLKKKFLQQEVEKMLQKRCAESETKARQFKQRNDNDLFGLREDLKSMKDVIMKLKTDDKKTSSNNRSKQSELEERCFNYEKTIGKILDELQIQRQKNSVLQEANAQSQVWTENTQKFSQSIKIELENLTAKHLKCDETVRQLQNAHKRISQLQRKEIDFDLYQKQKELKEKQLSQSIEILNQKLQEKELETQSSKKTIYQLRTNISLLQERIESLSINNSSKDHLQQELKEARSTYEQLLEDKQMIEEQFLKKIQSIQNELKQVTNSKKKLQDILGKQSQQIINLEQKLKRQASNNHKLQNQIKKMEAQLNKTTIDLGNTKVKLGGLSSMEQKCQQLYEEIKKEKSKWNKFSQEACIQRESFQQKINQLSTLNQKLEEKASNISKRCSQMQQQNQKFKDDNIRLIEDKAKLAKQLKNAEQLLRDHQKLRFQCAHLNSVESRLKSKELEWKTEKDCLQSKIYSLQNQVKASLEAAKKRSEELHQSNQAMENQIQRLLDQKQVLYQRFSLLQDSVIKNEEQTAHMKQLLSEKQSKIEQKIDCLIEADRKLESLTSQLKLSEQSNDNLKMKINQKQQIINQKDHYFEKQRQSLQQKSSKLEQLAIEIDNKQSEICQMKSENNAKQQIIFELSNKLKNNENVIITQIQKLKELEQKLERTQILLEESTQNLSKIQASGRTIIIQLEQRYQSIKIKLQLTERQTRQLKQKQSENQDLIHTERQIREQCQSKVKSLQSLNYSLTSQIQHLQSQSKRDSQQLSWYQDEISLKNRSIEELKQTIRAVKNQSMVIKEEVDAYRAEFEQLKEQKDQQTNKMMEEIQKFQQLEVLTHQHMLYVKQRLQDLTNDKIDIQIQLRRTLEENTKLQYHIDNLQIQIQGGVRNWDDVKMLQAKIEQMCSIQQDQRRLLEHERNQFKLDLQFKQKQLGMIKQMLEEERASFSNKLANVQTQVLTTNSNLHSESILSQRLTKIIEQKQATINKLSEKNALYEQKRIKIINEVHSIQNQISQLTDRNSILQADNIDLHQKVREAAQKIKIYQQKLNILMENKYAMEQHKNALEDQLKLYHQQILKAKSRQKSLQEEAQNKINQVCSITQQTKNQTVRIWKQKSEELHNEIRASHQKIHQKDQQMEELVKRERKLQEVLRQNHVLLAEQRTQRQKLTAINAQLSLAIQNTNIQFTNKQRDLECLIRDRTILRQKLTEMEVKYEGLSKRYEKIQQEKFMAHHQIQNQSVTIRILREENKNIQKVMTEQLDQRKTIIEQLVNEKRMLYTQFNHQ